jgi:hypothetical protein
MCATHVLLQSYFSMVDNFKYSVSFYLYVCDIIRKHKKVNVIDNYIKTYFIFKIGYNSNVTYTYNHTDICIF